MINNIDVVQTHALSVRRVDNTRWNICLKADQSQVGTLNTAANSWHLKIDPPYRRRQFAKQTLTALLAMTGCPSKTTASISPDNTAARRLLESCGFQAESPDSNQYTGPDAASAKANQAAQLRQAASSYPDELAALHTKLLVPADYGEAHQLTPIQEAVALSSIGKDVFDRPQHLTPAAAAAWQKLTDAADTDQIRLLPVSGYRSVAYQAQIIERKLESGQQPELVFSVSAAPGFSEHHSGNAIDLCDGEGEPLIESFEETEAFSWLSEHAADFGFFLSFPRNNRHKLIYEPWHWCFNPELP